MSARSLSTAGEPMNRDENRQRRPALGYGALVRWLGETLAASTEVRLATVAHEVRWARGRVEVRARNAAGAAVGPFRARRLVITLPIGVLQAEEGAPAAVRFRPALPNQGALDGMAVSPVVKLTLRFRRRLWPDEAEFLHAEGAPFPTLWTPAPLRAPLLTAWAGGPAADALADVSPARRVALALETAAHMLGRPRRALDDALDGVATHDWQRDRFSRGAYSYVRVGASSAPARLARPIEGTLFFAGEATQGDETGTVSGAMASGRAAARRVLAALARE